MRRLRAQGYEPTGSRCSTKRIQYLEQNLASLNVTLDAADVQRLNQALPIGAASGTRYPATGMKGLA